MCLIHLGTRVHTCTSLFEMAKMLHSGLISFSLMMPNCDLLEEGKMVLKFWSLSQQLRKINQWNYLHTMLLLLYFFIFWDLVLLWSPYYLDSNAIQAAPKLAMLLWKCSECWHYGYVPPNQVQHVHLIMVS